MSRINTETQRMAEFKVQVQAGRGVNQRPGTRGLDVDVRVRPAQPLATIAQALREAIAEEMRRDDSVFLIGEDVGRLW